jgi:probable rRNA maturation factor
VIEVEASCAPGVRADLPPLVATLRSAVGRLGVERATLGLMVVDAARMRALNREHRGVDAPTDVLSFPLDGPELAGGWPEDGPAPELGDVVVCPAAAGDPLEVLCVHGLLHLLGHDHETDDGEMLRLQGRLLEAAARAPGAGP